MRYLIILILVLTAASLQAQITLEHTYPNVKRDFSIVLVDSGVEKFIDYNRSDSIYIYNLDHSFDRVIIVPLKSPTNVLQLEYISKRLFDIDDSYEYLIENHGAGLIRIFKENGDILFRCDSCVLHNEQNSLQSATNFDASIISTQKGIKLLIEHFNYNVPGQEYVTVHGLPGKLPGSSTAKSGVNSPSIVSGNSLPISAYPNPSNGQMRISYKLPLGVATGELVILSTDAVEVKRYRVGYGFNDILVEKSDLPSGSYFYKLVTDKGESETQKLIILK